MSSAPFDVPLNVHLSPSSRPRRRRSLRAATLATQSTPGIHDRLSPPRRHSSTSRFSPLSPATPAPSQPGIYHRITTTTDRTVPPAMSSLAEPSRMSPLAVETWHRTLSQTDGRDKLFRLIQYLCKLLRGLDCGRNDPLPDTSAGRVAALESALGTSRQIWRLLKWASVYAKSRARMSALSTTAPPLPDAAAVLADAAMFLYYVADNVTFLHKVRLFSGDAKVAARRAARFWLAAVLAGLAGGVHNVMSLTKRERMLQKLIKEQKKDDEAGEQTEERRREYSATLRKKRAAMAVCAKHAGDSVVAFSLSRQNQLHPGLVGACGVVSSIVGFWQVWPKYLPTE